jgi:photosystem II stability/assembly factor-like uncharacterized protein
VRSITYLLGGLALATHLGAGAAPVFKSPLSTPSMPTALAAVSTLTGVTSAGKRLVGVGPRGHIVVSDDNGKTWSQKNISLSSDLVAVTFPTPQQGWVVGHDGVVLHSSDAGETWSKNLDGHQAAAIMLKYYGEMAKSGEPESVKFFDEAKRIAKEGADKPFLDVWFENAKVGYIIGAFNMIFKTIDGGASWTPWYHRIDNEMRLHLHAFGAADGALLLVGEQGMILRLDPEEERFVALQSPYEGSFFGIATKPGMVVAYGLRGNAYRSADAGKSWKKLDTKLNAGITGGVFLEDGRLVLASQGGELLQSADDGNSFTPVQTGDPMPWYGLAGTRVKGGVALVGARGVRIGALK